MYNLKFLPFTLLSVTLIPLMVSATPSMDRPNVVLITADDLGFQLGCYGDSDAITPRIDELAAEGVRFTQAHVTQASCSSSRSSMLTGLYPHESGQIGLANRGYSMVSGIQNLPGLLGQAGYHTGIIGKLHVSPGNEFPFDYRETATEPTRSQSSVRRMVGEFLDQTAQDSFFLMLNFFDPHLPFLRQVEGLPAVPVESDNVAPWGFQAGLVDPELMSRIADYRSCIHRLDTLVGIFLDMLEERNLHENTVIVFLSDNGPPFTRAKASEYRVGPHVPFIVKWPGQSDAGSSRDEMISGVDVFATILDAAGIETPSRSVARSLRPLMRSEVDSVEWRKTVFTEFSSHTAGNYFPRRSVSDGAYRLIWNLSTQSKNPLASIGAGPAPEVIKDSRYDGSIIQEIFKRYEQPPELELYDLEIDPYCLVNLAGLPGYENTMSELWAELDRWMKITSDPLRNQRVRLEWERLHRENGSMQWNIPRDEYPQPHACEDISKRG